MNQKPASRRISFFSGLLLLLNGIVVILLLLAYAAFHISPAAVPYLAFTGLAYPYILLANLIFILFWIIRRIKFAIIPLIIVLLGWNHMGRLFQWSGKEAIQDEGIKVISYNIQNFIKYNTSSTKYLKDFANQDRITNWLAEQSADIVCLQEMLYDRDNYEQFAAQLGKLIHCPNNYHENYYQTSRNKLDAIAIFTRFPVIDTGHLVYDDKSIGIYTDLVIGEDTVRLYNLHLASIHFRQEDYDFISELSTQQEQDKIKTGSRQIIEKMNLAFEKRALQAKVIEMEIEQSPYPVILCGDFNDTPNSFTYNRLTQNLKDAFVESGHGLGTTYAGENFPDFRIDYILHDAHFKSAGFERSKIELSDHYPVSCVLYPNVRNN